MPIAKLFQRILETRRLAQQTGPLALAIAIPVQKSLSPQVISMHRAEARGYIRGKTTPVVQAELNRLLGDHSAISADTRLAVAAEITERVVRRVLDELIRGRMVTTYRKAA